ncbi:MAG: glycosyltransferase family 39 protein [Myxococcaceae bacterium]|nr:glycosyltransferase family 39 protein [Myxococcaceae bacterium]MCI0669823.1 glycosyltransferase family 39 protein [Myxococcaceae bacterium]
MTPDHSSGTVSVDDVTVQTARARPRLLSSSSRAVLAVGWLTTLMVSYAILAGTGFTLRDPDSTLYEYIVRTLEPRPLAEWLAPHWQPGRWKQGLFQEHLAIFFWPAAALGRLGFTRGMLLANLAFHLGALWALFRLARHLAGEAAAWGAVFLYAVSPLGIQYVARGNHENAWALCTTAALLCFLRRREALRFSVGFVAWAVAAFAVKGVLGLLLFPAAFALWLAERPRWREVWLFVAALVAVGLTAALYELAYAAHTGESFFAGYVGAQLSYVERAEETGLWQKLLTPAYYAANLLYFALPGSLLLLVALVRPSRPLTSHPSSLPDSPPTSPLPLGEGQGEGVVRQRITASTGLRLVMLAGGAAVLGVSLMTRRAARYVFPVYPWLAIPAAQEALRRWPRLGRFLDARAQLLPWVLMGVVLLVVCGRALTNSVLTQHINPLR